MTGRLLRIGVWFGAVALWSTSSHAAPGDATKLEYARSAAAKNCPDRDALRSAVTKRLGYDPFFPVARQTIVVEIADVSDGLRARMNLVDEQGLIVGSRELRERTEHCDELVASLALAISIALDPSAALGGEAAVDSTATPASDRPDEPRDAPAALSEPDTAPSAVVPSRPAREHAPTSVKEGASKSTPIVARVGTFTATGVAPSLAFGLRAGIGVRRDWFQLVAEYGHQFTARHDGGRGGVQASLDQGSLAPCFAARWLAACAILNVGALSAEGRGVAEPLKSRTLYAALGTRLEATPELVAHLRLLLSVDAFRSLTPVTLRLRGESIWATPLVSAALGIGLQLQFP